MKKRKENDNEFLLENFGARKAKEERELSAGQKQPLLLELLRRKEKCLSNRVYQGTCMGTIPDKFLKKPK